MNSVVSSAKLIMIKKKPTGQRPIAVGETLRRVAGRFLSQWLKEEAIQALGPDQTAMQSNGTTKMVFAVRNTMERHKHFVGIFPDAKNAFNTLSRRSAVVQMGGMSTRIH